MRGTVKIGVRTWTWHMFGVGRLVVGCHAWRTSRGIDKVSAREFWRAVRLGKNGQVLEVAWLQLDRGELVAVKEAA